MKSQTLAALRVGRCVVGGRPGAGSGDTDGGARRALPPGTRVGVCALLLSAALLSAGCTKQAAPATPGDDVVTVLVSGASTEPRPMLTPRAVEILRAAAGHSAARASIINVNSGPRTVLPLTPRRADGSVEHGFQRTSLIDENIRQVEMAVERETASGPGIDLLDAMDRNVRVASSGTLIVVSNGLSTEGAFDIRKVGWRATSDGVVNDLARRELLPNLRGWHVLWVGLNETWGDQPKLPKPVRDADARYWAAICSAGGAASCEFDLTPLSPTPGASAVDSYLVSVPWMESISGPGGTTIVVPDVLLGFPPDSATLGPAAVETIPTLAARIVEAGNVHQHVTVTVTGFTADPPGSTVPACQRLSHDRAQSVTTALLAAGIGVGVTVAVVGGGVAPGMSAMQNGEFNEALAESMRRVEVGVRAN